MRGRSYTPSPPRGYGRRERSPPRGGGGRYGRGGRDRDDAPTSLLVRNLRHDCRLVCCTFHCSVLPSLENKFTSSIKERECRILNPQFLFAGQKTCGGHLDNLARLKTFICLGTTTLGELDRLAWHSISLLPFCISLHIILRNQAHFFAWLSSVAFFF